MADFEAGDYRWVVQVTHHLVFADPANQPARQLAADAMEQLAYQSESSTWRNAYALGAKVGPLCRRHWATIRQQLALRQSRLQLPAGGKRLKGDKLAQWLRDQSDTNVAIAVAARAACRLKTGVLNLSYLPAKGE